MAELTRNCQPENKVYGYSPAEGSMARFGALGSRRNGWEQGDRGAPASETALASAPTTLGLTMLLRLQSRCHMRRLSALLDKSAVYRVVRSAAGGARNECLSNQIGALSELLAVVTRAATTACRILIESESQRRIRHPRAERPNPSAARLSPLTCGSYQEAHRLNQYTACSSGGASRHG